MRRWVGFDLDGCLAIVDESRPYDGSIGEPNPPMVVCVRRFLEQCRDVRIFTARVASPIQKWEGYDFPVEEYAIRHQRDLIREWTQRHIGRALEATAVKDHLCDAIFDDRAVHVDHNLAYDGVGAWLSKRLGGLV